ncbi:MAG TPA: TonB-dependent receptor, partial [Nannocystaceae bacterium]|nr:TonB-dependent receptor [Nannocystaceae bacterium]
AINPRHRLELTVLSTPGFARRSYRQQVADGHASPSSGGVDPFGGTTRVSDGLLGGTFGSDRSNATLATLGYRGRLADDRLELDAGLSYSEGVSIQGWKLDHATLRDEVATQEYSNAGTSLAALLDRDDALQRVPGVEAACGAAGGATCPVRQWLSGGMGQYQRWRTRDVAGRVAFTHYFNAAGAHRLSYGAQVDHAESREESRYSGRNADDFQHEEPGERVDNHRFVFADVDDPDRRVTIGYGRVHRELGQLRAITDASGAATRVDGYRARVSTQNYGLYLQDKWAIRSNLFLSLGVRWELQDLRDVFGRRAVLLWDNVAPRIGLSYDWTDEGRSRLFASYGWFYQPLPLMLASRVLGGRVNVQRSYRNSDCVDRQVVVDGRTLDRFANGQPTERCPDTDAGATQPLGAGHVPHLRGQYNQQFQAGYEQEIVEDLILGVRWLHNDLGRAVEDVSTNGGLDVILANPGVGVADDDVRKQAAQCRQLQSDLAARTLDDPGRGSIARELARCEQLEDAFRRVGSAFARPRRSFDAFTFELRKRFSRNWTLAASYTYSRLIGNYDGFVDPLSGPIDLGASTQYDLPELVRNSFGPLSANAPHRVRLEAFYSFDLGESGRLTLASALRFSSGYPISLRAGHERYPGLFPVYLLPRGAGGHLRPSYQWNLGFSYAYPLPADLELELAIRWFNVTNARMAMRVDEVYSYDTARPIAGGDRSDLAHAKAQHSADPSAFFQREVVTRQGNYGVATRFQSPIAAQLELALRF